MFLAPAPNISALAMTALIEDAGGVVWRRIPWLPGSQPPPSVARSCRDKALGAVKGATLAAAAVACVYYLNRDADQLAMRDLPRIRAAVSEAGFPDATIKPAFVNCSGRDRGYRWVSSAGYGTACPNYRGEVRVQVDHRDRP